MEFVPGCAQLLGVPPSPGPLRNLRKYVYHLSRDQVAALRAPHDRTRNPGGLPWNWSTGVFERLQARKRAVPRGTIKITIEMPAAYTGVEMPRDLLVRDDAELARIAMAEQMADDDDDSELNDDDDSELSELEDEMFEGPEMWFLHARRLTQEERKEAKKQNSHEAEDKDRNDDEEKDNEDEEENEDGEEGEE
jgi:hypothetical protein